MTNTLRVMNLLEMGEAQFAKQLLADQLKPEYWSEIHEQFKKDAPKPQDTTPA